MGKLTTLGEITERGGEWIMGELKTPMREKHFANLGTMGALGKGEGAL